MKINTTLVTDTVYTDSTLQDSGLYEYKVAAVDTADDIGTMSSGQTVLFQNRLRLAVSSAGFGKRRDHSSVVFDSKIWVIGGMNTSGKLGDVWYIE